MLKVLGNFYRRLSTIITELRRTTELKLSFCVNISAIISSKVAKTVF